MRATPTTATGLRRVRLLVRGRVQGVGFRPTLYRALTERGCAGLIRNTPEGVVLEVEGAPAAVAAVVSNFCDLIPPRGRVDEVEVEELPPTGQSGFRIEQSSSDGLSLLPIPPDLAICQECLSELRDPHDRRAGYPFNTCTGCGPRFTIARAVPFDRPTSSMDEFPLCGRCAAEYGDPADRRFHAQTTSCQACGPKLSFTAITSAPAPRASHQPAIGAQSGDPLAAARDMLKAGKMIAIKGLGGFHLACDATRQEVVQELRRRKQRPHKPLAVMVRDIQTCRRLCFTSEEEEAQLASAQAPIVLLRKRPGAPVAEGVAPGLSELGVMLPYAPLHAMLFDDPAVPPVLVMTSCNRSEEPIAVSAKAVVDGLSDIVDGVLSHDRPITNRCDDSVAALFCGQPLPMRRSRGYVPEPIFLDRDGPSVFAAGAMWKNTFALTSGRRAFLSQHIGDVSDADNAAHFAESFA